MNEHAKSATEHVGDLLSGYLDGELTQQQRQKVTLHCADCEPCREDLAELRTLRERIGGANLSEMGEDRWRENMNDATVELSRGIGWLLFLLGLMIAGSFLVYTLLTDSGMPLVVKFILVGVYGGLGVLLFSVLRQRLIERKTDKYKDVEI
jgi:predicted anti-sigma-YlaC factor YlaD